MRTIFGGTLVFGIGLALVAGCNKRGRDAAGPVKAISHELDGKTFDVLLTEEGKTGDKDQLIFSKGTFDSIVCRPYGFTLAAYKTLKSGDGSVSFEATSKSLTEGTSVWKGKITGGKIEGTMVWAKGGKSTNFTFSGGGSGGKEWAIKADLAGACNCAVPCPCALAPPTRGYCEANQLIDIKKGHYKGVSLDGLSLVMSWRGGDWVKYYVSDKATDDQLAAVQKLMPAAYGFISKMKVLSAGKVPVSVERTPTTVKFSVPESKVEIELVRGRDGKPIITQNHPHPLKAIDLTQYKAIVFSHDGKDKKFSYSGTNGSTSKVDDASKD